MTKYFFCTIGMLGLCPWAFGQSAEIYGFFAPGQLRASSEFGGASRFAMNMGGGGRYIHKSGLGAGFEIGAAGPKEGWADYNFGLLSMNGYYVFKNDHKVEPFVTGGYSRSFGWSGGDMDLNWGNFGAGLTYWASRRAGVLLEFRDNVCRPGGVTVQLWAMRAGITLRLGSF
ncbi:MAG: hypothetical protein LAQ69_34795 [Acidobacteriia bacterium]|nr:hypothetical protein [Terriglobia bacterium]